MDDNGILLLTRHHVKLYKNIKAGTANDIKELN